MFKVNFHTGTGNLSGIETLDDAKEQADATATYTQESISIIDGDGNEVCYREWWGCKDGIDECEDPISFGDFGFYGDWTEVE